MIEDKLKQIRFGHRNEKIDYQFNDGNWSTGRAV